MSHHKNMAQSIKIKSGEILLNRFVKPAMSEQLGDTQGNPQPELKSLYKAWGEGGAGLLITGNVMVDRRFLGEPCNVILNEQSDLEAFRHWVGAVENTQSKLWMQLNHPGKQIPRYLSKHALAPSEIELGGGLAKVFAKPIAMSEIDIENLI